MQLHLSTAKGYHLLCESNTRGNFVSHATGHVPEVLSLLGHLNCENLTRNTNLSDFKKIIIIINKSEVWTVEQTLTITATDKTRFVNRIVVFSKIHRRFFATNRKALYLGKKGKKSIWQFRTKRLVFMTREGIRNSETRSVPSERIFKETCLYNHICILLKDVLFGIHLTRTYFVSLFWKHKGQGNTQAWFRDQQFVYFPCGLISHQLVNSSRLSVPGFRIVKPNFYLKIVKHE